MPLIWQGILSIAQENPNLVDFYLDNARLKVGNGEQIHFWYDIWCHNSRLCEVFPRLFSLSEENEGTLLHFSQRRGRSGEWNLVFRRLLRACEGEEVGRLLEWLNDIPVVIVHVEDCLRWELNSSGLFLVESVRKWFQAAKGFDLRIAK